MVSRQFKRRMKKIGKKNLRKYGSLRECPFDKFPCEIKPSPIDGGFSCGGAVFGDGVREVVLESPCYRFPFKESLKSV